MVGEKRKSTRAEKKTQNLRQGLVMTMPFIIAQTLVSLRFRV